MHIYTFIYIYTYIYINTHIHMYNIHIICIYAGIYIYMYYTFGCQSTKKTNTHICDLGVNSVPYWITGRQWTLHLW